MRWGRLRIYEDSEAYAAEPHGNADGAESQAAIFSCIIKKNSRLLRANSFADIYNRQRRRRFGRTSRESYARDRIEE